jgi:hypothetical protein
MFNCRNCGKSYESRKRYVEHIEVCEEDIQSLQSRPSHQSGVSRGSRQGSRQGSHQGSSLTSEKLTSRHRTSEDSTRQEGKLRRAVADLMEERTRLKGELGKSETDLRARVHAHREDITSTQEYYQGQVTSLMNERDELTHQLLKQRDNVIDDREKMQTEIMKKLANERKKLESREESNNARLTAEVDNLQNRLAGQIGDKEKNHTSFVKKLTEQDSTYQQQITKITEQLKMSNQALVNERAEMQGVILSKNEEEIAFQRIIVEKDDKMEKLMREKEACAAALEKRLVKERESHKTSMKQLQNELEEKIRERELSIRDIQSRREKEVSQMFSKLQGVEVESKKVIFEEHAKNVAETQEQILKLEMSHASVLESTCSRAARKIEESEEEVAGIKKKLLQADKIREDAVTKKECDVRIEQSSRLDELNKSILLHQETTARTKIETNTVVEHLKTENGHMMNAVKESGLELTRMVSETALVRSQFIINLNKQRTELENVVNQRELVIEDLRIELENQNVECETKIALANSITKTYMSDHERLVKKQKTEISILHDAVTSNSGLYNKKETEWKKFETEWKKLETEWLQHTHNFQTEKALELKNIIDKHEKEMNLTRKDFIDKMNDQVTKHNAECIDIKHDAEGEVSKLRESLEDMRRDQNTLLDEQASLYEYRISHKQDELAKKAAVLSAREIELKSIPSDADFKIKKLREECVEKLKKGRVEIERLNANNIKLNKLREECVEKLTKGCVEIESLNATNIKLNGELQNTNSALDNKNTEIILIKENHNNLKNSLLINLNNQKDAMDRTLEERDVLINKRDTRISVLEDLIKKTTVNKS